MKTKNEIIIDEDFLDASIWMSYKYCIGRRSISAICRAQDTAKYCKHLLENRRKFLAQDIRKELSSILNFSDIYIYGDEYNYDPFSIIYSYMNSNKIDFAKNNVFINVFDGSIKIEPKSEVEVTSRTYDPKEDSCIIIPWIELANYMNEEFYNVEVEHNGKREIYKCIKSYNAVTLECRYVSLDVYEKGNSWSINSDIIKRISKI